MTREHGRKQLSGQPGAPGRWSRVALGLAALLAVVVAETRCLGEGPSTLAPPGGGCIETNLIIPFVLVAVPGSSAVPVSFELTIRGLSKDETFRILVGDSEARTEILERNADGLRVKARLPPWEMKPASYDLSVEWRNRRYTDLRAFHVVPRPIVGDRACDGGEVTTFSGDLLAIHAPDIPEGSELLAHIGESRPAIRTSAADGRYEIDLSKLGPGSSTLELSLAWAGNRGTSPLCRQTIARVQTAQPTVEAIFATYAVATKTVHVRLEGTDLPDTVQGMVETREGSHGEIPLVAERNATGGRFYTGRLSEPANRLTHLEIRIDGRTLHRTLGRWSADGSDELTWRSFASVTEAALLDLFDERERHARIEIGGQPYELVKVPIGTYTLGLNTEQRRHPLLAEWNFAGPSSHAGGPLEVRLARPFLIGVYEITNAQFLSYLEEADPPELEVPEQLRGSRLAELPDDLAKLPVTGVSYPAVRRFVAWLGSRLAEETSGWRLRLPHEIEWEMAARGGQALDYAFVNQMLDEGLRSLAQAGPKPVGTNRWDRSPFWVHDLTGNVREWTQTVYQETLLDMLAFHQSSGVFEAWDPSQPYRTLFAELADGDLGSVSGRITLRGAANGERDQVLYLLSLRRQKELSTSGADVGFRVVLVPRMEG